MAEISQMNFIALRVVLLLGLIGAFFSGTSSAQPSNIHYAIVAPKTLRPSSIYNVTATVYNVSSDVRLQLYLKDINYNILAQTELVLKNGQTEMISMQIPTEVPSTAYMYYLIANGTGGWNFLNTQSIQVKKKSLSLFVQTDKATYKPGQTVLFRALVVTPDLLPYQGFVDIVVQDPDDNKIMQWLSQKNQSGVFSHSLPLSDQTSLGTWKISVSAAGNAFTKTFDVAEYVLPKFKVTVNLPSYYLVKRNRQDQQENLRITVTAEYTYGQPVKGRTNITIQFLQQPTYYMYPPSTYNNTQIKKDSQLVNGKADFVVTLDELLALKPRNQYGAIDASQQTILVAASVNETLTGIFQSANATVACKSEKYALEFLDISPNNFKPGLLYTAYIRLSQVDGTAPELADITFPGGTPRQIDIKSTMTSYYLRYNYPNNFPPVGPPVGPSDGRGPIGGGPLGPPTSQFPFGAPGPAPGTGMPYYNGPYLASTYSVTYNEVEVEPSGYMRFALMIDANVSSVTFELSFYVNVTNTTVYGYKSINAFKSRDNQSIQISFDSQNGAVIMPEEVVSFNVITTTQITTFQYEVLGKGNILLSDNVVGESSANHSFSIWISEDLALRLAPSARIVVWFVTDTGEIIADSIQLVVSDAFANKVTLSFDRNLTTPSQNVSLTVNAYGGSYIGILAVDQSVLLLKGGNDLTQDMINEDLSAYDNANLGSSGASKRRRKRQIDYGLDYWWYSRYYWPIAISGVYSQDILSNSGLVFATDGYFYYGSSAIPRWPYDQNGQPVGPLFPSGPAGQPGIQGPGGQTGFTFRPTWLSTQMYSQQPTVNNGINEPVQPRVLFPETWLWAEATTSADGNVTIRTTVPDTITSWIVSALALSPVAGLGVAENTAKLTVFKQFFLSPVLPYSIIRGEEFALEVSVFNYMSSRLNIVVTLQQSIYYKIEGSASKLAQVESNDAVSVYFWIVAGVLGQIPIHISAWSPVAGDSMIVMLLVKPEGVQQQYSTSVFVQLPSSGSTFNTSFNVSLPPAEIMVPGSESIEITVIGDLMGQSIKGLGNLLQMPYGCGEQNMVNFAPDIYILKYLTESYQLTAEIKTQALGLLVTGYQRELTYQRTDGSFSAFGDRDASGSVWLTAFVVKCLHEAQDYITVDNLKIADAMRWIIGNQAPNGSFYEPPLSRILSSAMQGGSSKGLALTAYVLIALLENGNNAAISNTLLQRSITLARSYLEDQVQNSATDPYVLCITSYALARANSSKVNDVLRMMESLVIVGAGTRHWEQGSKKTDDSTPVYWNPPYLQSRAVNIEMTSYALLTYCYQKNLSVSIQIVKWIVAQRNANGGFSSTQDTVVALQALAEYASLTVGGPGESNLHVSLATDTLKYDFLPITSETSILLQSFELPSSTRAIFVYVSGSGSAVIQMNVQYNVYQTNDNSGIDLKVNSTLDGNTLTVNSCSSWMKDEGSGMVVMEINQLTGFTATNLNELLNQDDGNIKRIENTDGKVVIYLDELTSNKTCVNVISSKDYVVNKLQEVPVKVYPYYDPSNVRTKFYGAPQSLAQNSVCDECPQCCMSQIRTTPTPLLKRSTASKKTIAAIVAEGHGTTPLPRKPNAQ